MLVTGGGGGGHAFSAPGVGAPCRYVEVLRAPPCPFGQRWIDCVPPLPVFIDLRLAGIQQRQQPGIVRVVGVVDDGVLEIGGGDGGAGREVRGVAGQNGDRVGAVLQDARGSNDEIDARNAGVSEREVAARVRVESVEIEGRVGQVVGAVVEDDDQAVERRAAGAAIVELDEFGRVRAGSVGVQLVDEDVGRDGRRRAGRREREGEVQLHLVGRIIRVGVGDLRWP